MKHLRKFNENWTNDDWKSLIGSKVISIDVKDETFVLNTEDGKLNIACIGGNHIDYSLDYHRFGDVRGLTIEDIQKVDEYTAYILFDDGLSMNVYDDTGGEGIEMWIK